MRRGCNEDQLNSYLVHAVFSSSPNTLLLKPKLCSHLGQKVVWFKEGCSCWLCSLFPVVGINVSGVIAAINVSGVMVDFYCLHFEDDM